MTSNHEIDEFLEKWENKKRDDAEAGKSSDPADHGIESIKEWCLSAMEGADGALDTMLCEIVGAIEEYQHPELTRAETKRSVDREALLALADELETGFRIEGSTGPAHQVVHFVNIELRKYARRIRETLGVKS